MKNFKTIGIILLVIALLAGAYVIGMMKGANLVRNGLLQNYPSVYNIIAGSQVEVDTVVELTLTREQDSSLFALLQGNAKTDTLNVRLPYYGRYGINLSRYRRVVPDGNLVEVALPDIKMYYCEIKFAEARLNGTPLSAKFEGGKYRDITNKLYGYVLPLLSKDKSNKAKARESVIKALAYYILPYKFELRIYIDNELQTIPVIPGANKDVDEFIKEQFNKS